MFSKVQLGDTPRQRHEWRMVGRWLMAVTLLASLVLRFMGLDFATFSTMVVGFAAAFSFLVAGLAPTGRLAVFFAVMSLSIAGGLYYLGYVHGSREREEWQQKLQEVIRGTAELEQSRRQLDETFQASWPTTRPRDEE